MWIFYIILLIFYIIIYFKREGILIKKMTYWLFF